MKEAACFSLTLETIYTTNLRHFPVPYTIHTEIKGGQLEQFRRTFRKQPGKSHVFIHQVQRTVATLMTA